MWLLTGAQTLLLPPMYSMIIFKIVWLFADVEEKYRIMWHVIMIIPILLIIPLMRYIVKVSSVVKALAHIRQDTVAKVMEDDDAVRNRFVDDNNSCDC